MVAYYEHLTDAKTNYPILAVPDETISIDEQDVQVPAANKIIHACAVGAALSEVRINSPSLRAMYPFYVSPIETNNYISKNDVVIDLRNNPLELVIEESMNAEVTTTGASDPIIGLLMADAVPAPVTGKIFSVKATSNTTLVPYQWTNCEIEFDVDIPAGEYDIVGFRAESNGAVLARIVFKGEAYRPGVFALQTDSSTNIKEFRNGNYGLFGSFKHNVKPSVEVLSRTADTSEIFYFDLIKK